MKRAPESPTETGTGRCIPQQRGRSDSARPPPKPGSGAVAGPRGQRRPNAAAPTSTRPGKPGRGRHRGPRGPRSCPVAVRPTPGRTGQGRASASGPTRHRRCARYQPARGPGGADADADAGAAHFPNSNGQRGRCERCPARVRSTARNRCWTVFGRSNLQTDSGQVVQRPKRASRAAHSQPSSTAT